MENTWGIKISRIALPEQRPSFNEWVKMLNVSSNYKLNNNFYHALNSDYDFSKIKNKQYEPTNTGA
jgi:hypothetical protein